MRFHQASRATRFLLGVLASNLVLSMAGAVNQLDEFCLKDFRGIGRNSFQYYQQQIAEPGRYLLGKPELETLFGLRERLVAAGGKGTIASGPEASLIARIQKKTVKLGEPIELRRLDDEILLSAFKRLAYERAVEKKKVFADAELDDLIQASMTGLMTAIRRYKSTDTVMFSTVARQQMNHEIDEVLRTSGSAVSRAETASTFGVARRMARIGYELREKLKRAPSARELADAWNLKYKSKTTPQNVLEKLEEYRANKLTANEELIEPKSSEGIANSNGPVKVDVLEMLPSEAPLLEEAYLMKQRGAKISQMILNDLPPVEREILSEYHGVVAHGKGKEYWIEETSPKTLQEVADSRGLTRERIRQILGKAERRMKRGVRQDMTTNELLELERDTGAFPDPLDTSNPLDRHLDFLGF